jgi:hypothetical protein
MWEQAARVRSVQSAVMDEPTSPRSSHPGHLPFLSTQHWRVFSGQCVGPATGWVQKAAEEGRASPPLNTGARLELDWMRRHWRFTWARWVGLGKLARREIETGTGTQGIPGTGQHDYGVGAWRQTRQKGSYSITLTTGRVWGWVVGRTAGGTTCFGACVNYGPIRHYQMF